MSNITNIAIAPAHPAGVGHATQGGHVKAWKAQGAFATSDKLALVNPAVNPWRSVDSKAFFSDVLVPVLGASGGTVQQVLDAGAAKGIKAGRVQAQLRWLYTWGGHMSVNGKMYSVPAAPVAAPKAAPKAAKVAKPKAPAKA